VPIEAGQQLLHYRLIEKIGEGGMGVVWKATDTTLDREVAIKILPDAFADDAQRLARFEREAKLLAALNHPNIAAVYGLHDSDGTRFLAMELVPGEDLAERLGRGWLPVDDAIGIARQITEALEAAHARGVVHRDLKPANIVITTGGAVKVLDFGLAKAMASASSPDADPSLSPTMTSVGSIAGVLLGTAAYMSPEQVRCREVDERSDIWAFGCVLWECLTRKTLFAGPTASDSLAAILHTEPDHDRLPVDTPSNVRRVLRRCLAKDPRDRYHHIADARIELDDTERERSQVRRTPRGAWIAVAVLAMALLASVVFWLPSFLGSPTDPEGQPSDNPLARARFSAVTDLPSSELGGSISPDGRFVAFVSDRDGPFEVYVGQIGGSDFRKVSGGSGGFRVEDARAPVRSVGFDSDGSELWIGGGTGHRLQLAPLLGGPARNFLGDDVVEVAWSPDGERIVYHTNHAGDPTYVADRDGTNSRLILGSDGGMHQHNPTWSVDGQWIYLTRGRPTTFEVDLWRVRPDGGELEQITRNELDVRDPTPIDEKTVIYSARDADGAGPWLWAVDVETKRSRRVTVGLEQYASVSASADRSRLVATLQDPRGTLWSVPILDRPATESDAEPYPGLRTTHAMAPRFGGGSLFFLSSRGSGDGLWRFRDGTVSEIWKGSKTALLEPAAVAPDGESVVLLLRKDEGWHLHLLSADGAVLNVLSRSVDARGAAAWSPDGRWIVVGGSEAGVRGLFKIPVDGGAAERIVDGEALNPVWSPDGSMIVYAGPQVGPGTPLVAVRPDGTPVELPEIRVWRAGERARFLPDGSGLIYMQGSQSSQEFWLLDLATMESRRLTRLGPGAAMRTFDVTPDGKRIVFDRLSENSDIVLIELEPPE
jgi:serine/threonine protein kinase